MQGIWEKMSKFVFHYKVKLMQNKIFNTVWALFLCFVFAGCSSDSFKLVGEIPDAGDQSLSAIYVNEAGVQTMTAPVVEGRFEMEGISPNYTVLYLYDGKKNLITKVVLRNGDKVELKGTLKHSALLDIEGNDAVEDWNKFRKENHLLYSEDGEEEALDNKIEEYIESNGDKMASLLLLLHDYSDLSDTKRVHELLNVIQEDKRPANLMKAYADMNAEMQKKSTRTKFHSFELYNEKDSLVLFMPLRSHVSVMYFWGVDDDGRKGVISEMDSLYKKYDDKKLLQIADVVIDSDTVRWKRILRREKKEWNHYWAVGGPVNKAIADLEIKSSPVLLVLDSIGQEIYRGDSIGAVTRLVKARLDKKSKESKKNKKKK